jgi:hypothetical protein
MAHRYTVEFEDGKTWNSGDTICMGAYYSVLRSASIAKWTQHLRCPSQINHKVSVADRHKVIAMLQHIGFAVTADEKAENFTLQVKDHGQVATMIALNITRSLNEDVGLEGETTAGNLPFWPMFLKHGNLDMTPHELFNVMLLSINAMSPLWTGHSLLQPSVYDPYKRPVLKPVTAAQFKKLMTPEKEIVTSTTGHIPRINVDAAVLNNFRKNIQAAETLASCMTIWEALCNVSTS